MNPGRDLDKKIAEHLGYQRIEFKKQGHSDVLLLVGVKPGERPTHTGYMPQYEIPYFSTDIAAAWEVVQEMQSNKWVFRIESPYCNASPAEWTAYFGWKHVSDDDFSNHAQASESEAHAICLAALKAWEA